MPANDAMDSVPKAPLPIQFIVIGSSISGLACAYALRRAGHRILVLEQTDGKYRSRGGIRSPPNMTRLLHTWPGVGDALSNMGVKCSGFTFKLGETGETIGLLKLHEKLMKALRADYLFVQHGDIHSLLFERASKAGVDFEFNSKIVRVDPHSGTVYSSSGSTYSGDVIIGADGYKSMIRPVVLGSQPQPGITDRRLSLNLTLPAGLLAQHEDLLPFTESTECRIWMGNDSSIYGYLSSQEEYAMIVTLPALDDPFEEHWSDHFDMESLHFNFQSYEPRVRKIIKLARTVTPTKHVIREPLDNWVHESGKVVLVGDAAHPLMPNGSHNASMAVEDAVTLGNLFAHLRKREQIPLLLSAYEEIRQPRCATTQQSEREQRDFISLPHGTEQRARDQGLREAMAHALIDWDEADEEYLRVTWDEYIDLFAYDANEVAEDWWTKWGPLVERNSSNRTHRFRYEVSISTKDGVTCE